MRSSEGYAEELPHRGVRGGQQRGALHRGLLHGTLLSQLRDEDVLEVLILPDEVLQGNERAATHGHLEQLDVQLDPKGIGCIHGLHSLLLLLLRPSLGLLVRGCLAENAEAALVLRVVAHADPLEARGLRGAGVSKGGELLMAAPQHGVEALQGVQAPLLHEPTHDVAPVQLQRLEELRLRNLQALLVEGVMGGQISQGGEQPLHPLRIEVALRNVPEHQNLVGVEPAGELVALILTAGLLLCRLRQLFQPPIEPWQDFALEGAPQQAPATPQIFQDAGRGGEPRPGPRHLALGVVHQKRRGGLHTHRQAHREEDRRHRFRGHGGREA